MPGTLVLDSSGRIPLEVVPVEDAVSDMLLGKCFPLLNWEGRRFRSERLTVEAPKVVCKRAYARVPSEFTEAVSNRLLFARDLYRCQYCGLYHRRYRWDLPPERWLPIGSFLTRDHVKPTSRHEGRTEHERLARSDNWENVATACNRCNNAKGDSLPWQCGMYPLRVPVRPTGVILTFPHKLDWEQMGFVSHLLD